MQSDGRQVAQYNPDFLFQLEVKIDTRIYLFIDLVKVPTEEKNTCIQYRWAIIVCLYICIYLILYHSDAPQKVPDFSNFLREHMALNQPSCPPLGTLVPFFGILALNIWLIRTLCLNFHGNSKFSWLFWLNLGCTRDVPYII